MEKNSPIYIRVTKNLAPVSMDEYLDSMTLMYDGIDLARTSKILLDNYNLESYREEKILHQKRADLLDSFTPAQIEILLRFGSRELSVVRAIAQLEEPQRRYVRELGRFVIGLYKNWGGEKLRRLTIRAPQLRNDFLSGKGLRWIVREFPGIEEMDQFERLQISRFTDSMRANEINPESENLIRALHDFGPVEFDNYQRLTNEEMNFFRDLNQDNLNRFVHFQERALVPLVLGRNQRWVIEKIEREGFASLDEGEQQVYETIPEIFDRYSEREMKIWRTIAPLTDEQVGRLTNEDLDLIAVHPKLRDPEILRRYVNLDGTERTRIVNLHREFGEEEFLSQFEESLLHEYIRTNLASTIWSGKDRRSMLMKLKDQQWNERMINTKLLAAAAVMGPVNHDITRELVEIGEPPVAYALRWLQYCGLDRTEQLPYVRKIIFENEPVSRRNIFNFADPEDVDFVESMIRDSLVVEDKEMFNFLIPTVLDSGNRRLLEVMRTGLKANGYRGTKILYFENNMPSEWLTRIFKPEEVFEFLQLHRGNYGEPGTNLFESSMEYGEGDPLPLLKHLNRERLEIIYHESTNYLPKREHVWRYFRNSFVGSPDAVEDEGIPRWDLLGVGCGPRRKRELGSNCVDSRNEKTESKKLYKTIVKVEKFANRVGLGYTVFTVGKHVLNNDIQGMSLDVLNIWAMPNLGKLVTSTMMKAESPLLRMGGPVVGPVVGNLFAFVGLYFSVKEYRNAKDNFDKAIAGLHFMSNSVYIGSLWAGPYGLAISVAVFITSDIMEGILRMEQLDQKIHLTWAEKFDYLWHSFWGMSVLEEKKYYNEFIERVLSSYGKDYDRIVIFLPDILVTKRDYVPKTSSSSWLQRWYDSFEPACKGEKKIVAQRFFYEIRSIFKDFLNNDTLTSRNIPDRVNGSYLTFGPTMEDVIGHHVSTSISKADPTEKCYQMRMDEAMDARNTVEEWAFKKNVIAYNRFGNSSITMYHIPIMTAELELFHNKPIDVYFNGMNINITGHGEPTTNKFIFTNNLTRCDIRTRGTNVFYVQKNNFTCNLTGGYNVGIVKADFEDAKNLDEIVGSEDTEELTISYAKQVDGRGGNDTIIGNNYTVVQSHWGDWIIGKTLTVLPMNVSEIDKIVYDKGFLIYNDKNQFVGIDEASMIKTLDSFVLTPSKTHNEIHVHKFVEKNVTLAEGLKELRGIRNAKFEMVKQLSSRNYEIMLGDSGHNVFYPDKEFVNFYWEGTKDVYVFPRINANITISRANGVLDFHLLPEAYYKIVIEPQENNDFVITYDNLRVRVLNDYKNISFAMYNNRDYKLNNWKLVRDYCTKPFEITGDGMVAATDLIHSYNCFDFESDNIMFFKVKENLLLTSGMSSLLIRNYRETYLDLAVRVDGKILITPDEFRDRVETSNIMNLYKIKEEGIEIFHNQPENQNKIGLMEFGDRSINDFRGVIGDKDLNIVYKDKPLVVIRNWMTRPEARKIMFVFQDRTIDNEDCIVNNDCKPGAILDKFPSNNNDSIIFQPQICKDNVALVCLLAQHYLEKKCPLPKFRSHEKNICVEAFQIVQLIKQQSKKSGNHAAVEEDYSLYERIVKDMRNGNYSGIKGISKPLDSDGFFVTLMTNVRKVFNMLFN